MTSVIRSESRSSKDARVPDLEYHTKLVFLVRARFLPEFPVVLKVLKSEISEFPIPSCFEHDNRGGALYFIHRRHL
jgi:hypothetical protein